MMEIIVGLAIILALNEWRDYKFNRKHRSIEAQFKKLSRQLHYVGDLAEKIDANNKAIETLKIEAAPIHEFIAKAQVDLHTIVNEYEVNGVPLGFDRTGGRKFDMVEGL